MNQLSTHFNVKEFTDSDTALRLNIDNSLPIDLWKNAVTTAEMLERIREHLCSPIIITSGYRCIPLNRAIGSKDTSDHTKALAADFKAPKAGSPLYIAQQLAPLVDMLNIGQLIYEHTWLHVSTRVPDKIINRILTVRGNDYVVGIKE